jgi:CheY-like chemotaxis protein
MMHRVPLRLEDRLSAMTQDPPDRRHPDVPLTRRQRDAVDAWNRARAVAEEAAASRTASREMRMDVTRRLEVLRAQHRAMVEQAQKHLAASARVLAGGADRRAVLVHRNEWFCRTLSTELSRRGIAVVEVLGNGAEGVGVVVAEQPDLLVVEDTLPMVPGEEVVRDARRFSPTTLVVAQVAYEDRIVPLMDAGAHAAYTRRVPPAEFATGAAVLLDAERDPSSAHV